MIRVPRIRGFPSITFGLISIRSVSGIARSIGPQTHPRLHGCPGGSPAHRAEHTRLGQSWLAVGGESSAVQGGHGKGGRGGPAVDGAGGGEEGNVKIQDLATILAFRLFP